VFRGISDNPNPGKGLLVPCIRRQRFTRIVKALKRISCHLELGNLNFHVPYHVKTYVHRKHRGENHYRYKIVAVVVYIFCGFPIKPRNLQPKNKLPLLQLETPLDFLSKDCCCRFSRHSKNEIEE